MEDRTVRTIAWFLAGAISCLIAITGGGVLFLKTRSDGFSAKSEPSALERWAARQGRSIALPAEFKARVNPVTDSPEVLADARAHWADHCAVCHSNNGSGDSEMGKWMYPRAPDMRLAATQDLTDGELFYIIQNGIRMTGMPAWGNGAMGDEQDSWKLVRFIRHLPKLTPEEEREMQDMNPKSPAEFREEQAEREFLEGGKPHEPAPHKHD
jgi:mono/diheme cytochrome c family protein